MSGKIKKCCLLHVHEEKTWTRSRALRNLNRLEAHSIAKKRNLSNQKQPRHTSTIPQAL